MYTNTKISKKTTILGARSLIIPNESLIYAITDVNSFELPMKAKPGI